VQKVGPLLAEAEGVAGGGEGEQGKDAGVSAVPIAARPIMNCQSAQAAPAKPL
jgi:hypothetical protein